MVLEINRRTLDHPEVYLGFEAKVKIEGMFPYLVKYFAALVAGILVITYVPQLSLLLVNLFQ